MNKRHAGEEGSCAPDPRIVSLFAVAECHFVNWRESMCRELPHIPCCHASLFNGLL